MPINHKNIIAFAIKTNPFIHSSLVFRRLVLEDIGLYNEQFLYAQDYELVLRILSRHKGANIAEPLILYRVGGKYTISVKKLKFQERFAIKARIKALRELGYPSWQSIYLLKPLLSYLVPVKIKLFLYRKFFWFN